MHLKDLKRKLVQYVLCCFGAECISFLFLMNVYESVHWSLNGSGGLNRDSSCYSDDLLHFLVFKKNTKLFRSCSFCHCILPSFIIN